MPIIAKNIIKKEEKPKQASLHPISKDIKKEPPVKQISNEGTFLIVNGKERKIGKKSQYLLDMLTLED